MQLSMFQHIRGHSVEPFSVQLLKWIGNKQRFAHEIASYFPANYCTYFEPFFGQRGGSGNASSQAGYRVG